MQAQGSVEAPAPELRRPPWPLRLLLALSLALAVFPLAYGVQYMRVWQRERAGKTVLEQRLMHASTPWFQPHFQAFAIWFCEAVPEDARVLLTPTVLEEPSGKARWFLFLNYYVFPRKLYVRQPHLASGTLVDYPRWLDHHFEVLNLDGHPALDFAGLLQREEVVEAEEAQVEDLGIDWELRYPVTRVFQPDRVQLLHRTGESWESVPVPRGTELLRLAGFQDGGAEQSERGKQE